MEEKIGHKYDIHTVLIQARRGALDGCEYILKLLFLCSDQLYLLNCVKIKRSQHYRDCFCSIYKLFGLFGKEYSQKGNPAVFLFFYRLYSSSFILACHGQQWSDSLFLAQHHLWCLYRRVFIYKQARWFCCFDY